MNRILENNNVVVSGEIISELEFNHEVFGEKFYKTRLSVERLSWAIDVIPIIVSERSINVSAKWTRVYVRVTGSLRTYNKNEAGRTRLLLSVFVTELEVLNEFSDEFQFSDFDNKVTLDGFICKTTGHRITPNGRDIADLLIAVNRPYGKSDYIPCICWGRNAVFASFLEVGTRIRVEGRFQSREYIKRHDNGTQETKVAYEVSISKIELVEETEISNADL